MHDLVLATATTTSLEPLVDDSAGGCVASLRLLHLRAALADDDEAAVVRHVLCAHDEREGWWPELPPVLDAVSLATLRAYADGLDAGREAVRSADVVSLAAYRAARSGADAPARLPAGPGVA